MSIAAPLQTKLTPAVETKQSATTFFTLVSETACPIDYDLEFARLKEKFRSSGSERVECIFTVNEKTKWVNLGNLNAPKRGSGFGTAVFHLLVKMCIDKKYEGISLHGWAAALGFYSRMRMLPECTNYVEEKYDKHYKEVLDTFSSFKKETDLQTLNIFKLIYLFNILIKEFNVDKKLLQVKIIDGEIVLSDPSLTYNTVWQHREALNALNIKTNPVLMRPEFMKKFLDCLEQNQGKKLAAMNTEKMGFGSPMILPKEHFHYYTQENGKGIPCNDFDHFLPLMTPKEKERYTRIMELRAKAEANVARVTEGNPGIEPEAQQTMLGLSAEPGFPSVTQATLF